MSLNINAADVHFTQKGTFAKAQIAGAQAAPAAEKKEKNADISVKAGFRPEVPARADISEKGKEKLQDMREKERALRDEEKQTRENMERVDGLLKKVNKGGTLSDEETAFVNDEIQTLASKNYVEKRTHVFTKDEMKEAMQHLKKNYQRRLQMFSSMQEQIESQGEALV